MCKDEKIDLNIDGSQFHNHDDYLTIWKKIGRIEIRCVESSDDCRYKAGDIFIYENPYKRPSGACEALIHVMDLYTWRVALGFPSWNSENRKIFKLHCPDPKGSVWEMKKIE